LEGGTLTQMLGYNNRIRDHRRPFWRRKQLSFLDVLIIARSIAEAMKYCHEEVIPGCVMLHRDLKPDNIGERIVCVPTSRYSLDSLYLTNAFFGNWLQALHWMAQSSSWTLVLRKLWRMHMWIQTTFTR
jgi:hypothetical protein